MRPIFARIAALVLLALGLTAAASAAAPQGGVITSVDGFVLTATADGRYLATGVGGRLNPGDQLLTVEGARAVVTFPDGGELSIARWSHVVLEDYAWDGRSGRNVMNVKLGAIRWTGGKLPPGTVTIKSPDTETTTQGTQIVMIVFPDGSTHEGVWDGGSKVRSLQDGKTYPLPKGAGATFKKGGGTDQLNGYQNWDQKTINAYFEELKSYNARVAQDPNYAANNPAPGWDWIKIWELAFNSDTWLASLRSKYDTKVPKPTENQFNGNKPQFYDDQVEAVLLALYTEINDIVETHGRTMDKDTAKRLKALRDLQKGFRAIADQAYPNAMALFPSSYDAPMTAPKGKIKNGNVTELGYAVDVPRTSIYDDPTISDTWSVFKGSWEEGLPAELRTRTVNARYAAKTTLGNLKGNTSAIGSYTGMRSFSDGKDPDDRNNDVPVGIFLINSNNLQETAWAVIEGNTVNFYEGDAFGPITAPGGAYIEGLNNSGRFQAVMVKEFKLGDDQRLFSLQGFAKFVTTEFPTYIGSQYNDTTKITLTTPGGQSVTLTGAQLFGASVNSSTFTAVSGLPAPLAGWAGGGETAWQAIFQRLRVAPGGRVRITVTVNNVGDTQFPSATLLGGLRGSGSR